MSFGKGGGDGLPSDQPFTGNPIARWKTDTGLYPSNAQSWWVYKRPVVLDTESPPRGYLEVFDTDIRRQLSLGNTPAPKGHFLLDAFDLDRAAVSGIPGLTAQSTNGARPRAVAFYAGRAFYAGVRSARFNSNVYFSQIIERDEQVGFCHQQQDPTEEEVPDLLPSDGGVIVIPEMAEVVKLFPKGDSLFVFATNGVWRISGSEGIGFRANDYSVTKVTDTPALSELSFVSADGNPLWWNRSGIWSLVPAQNGLDYAAQPLTDESIKTFFRDIPEESKKYAKGAYNHATRIIQWVYSSVAPTTVDERYQYDKILNLNVQTGGFYPWGVATSEFVDIKGIVAVEGTATAVETLDVTVDAENVTVNAEQVVIEQTVRVEVDGVFKYVVNLSEIV